MKEPVHVTVQMATVGLPVEVSALHGVPQVMHYFASGICLRHSFHYYLVFGHCLNKGDSFLYRIAGNFGGEFILADWRF